jgi:hypothetical protein
LRLRPFTAQEVIGEGKINEIDKNSKKRITREWKVRDLDRFWWGGENKSKAIPVTGHGGL